MDPYLILISAVLPDGGRPADDEGSSPPPPDGYDLSPLEGGLAPKARFRGRRRGGVTARDQADRVRGGTAKTGAHVDGDGDVTCEDFTLASRRALEQRTVRCFVVAPPPPAPASPTLVL